VYRGRAIKYYQIAGLRQAQPPGWFRCPSLSRARLSGFDKLSLRSGSATGMVPLPEPVEGRAIGLRQAQPSDRLSHRIHHKLSRRV